MLQRVLGLSVLTILVACGGAVAPPVPDPVPAAPSSEIDVAPKPAPPATPPSAPATTTTTTLDLQDIQAACNDARKTLVDGNRWDATHHFANGGELAVAIPGKWYACSKSPLFSNAGVSLHADGSSAALVFDGKALTENGVGIPWNADTDPPAGYEGITFLVGDTRYWAVLSLDGKQAVMGQPERGSSEWIYVRVD